MREAAAMPQTDSRIAELHAAYCQASGFDLPLRMGRDRVWFDFEKAGFTKEDLLLVIRWIRTQFGRNNGYSVNSLRFSTLLQLDYFEEKLLVARKELQRRPARPATVMAEQKAGDVSRLIEKPAPDNFERLAPIGSRILRECRERLAGPSLPTSEFRKAEEPASLPKQSDICSPQ